MKILNQLITTITARNPSGWLATALGKWSRAIPAGGAGVNGVLLSAPAEIQAVQGMTSIPKIIKIGVLGLGAAAALSYGKRLWREAVGGNNVNPTSHNPVTERGIDSTYEDYLSQNYAILLNRFSQEEILALECLCINAIFMRPGEFTKLHMDRGHFEDHREAIVRMRSIALSSWHNTHHKISYSEYDELIKGLVDQNFAAEGSDTVVQSNPNIPDQKGGQTGKVPMTPGDQGKIKDAFDKYRR
jgi:hypothetical protein